MGQVTLEGQTDHSGVRVSLYLPAELDAEVVDLNRRYPHIGVPISQRMEFDHRLARGAASTRTGKEGSFELEDVLKANTSSWPRRGVGGDMFLKWWSATVALFV